MNFQVDHTFYKLDVKNLAASNQVRALLLATIFIMSNRSVSTKGLIILALAKKAPKMNLKTNSL